MGLFEEWRRNDTWLIASTLCGSYLNKKVMGMGVPSIMTLIISFLICKIHNHNIMSSLVINKHRTVDVSMNPYP